MKRSHTIKGTIVSMKSQKTAVIEVVRIRQHTRYKKYIRITKHFKADTNNNPDLEEGMQVVIAETRPISRDKRWKIVSKETS